jgi:hypothetical protein
MALLKIQPQSNRPTVDNTPPPLEGEYSNWDEFFALAKPRLRARAEGFQKIFDYIKENLLENLTIVETGTYREINNFEGDGCSTLLFDLFVQYHGGQLFSVDIDPAACQLAESSTEYAQVIESDSVTFLSEFCDSISVLYLDSFNIQNWNHDHDAAAHHLKELFVAKETLDDGCLVIVDDNIKSPFDQKIIGKGRLVREVLHDVLGMELLVDDYQQAFIWNNR